MVLPHRLRSRVGRPVFCRRVSGGRIGQVHGMFSSISCPLGWAHSNGFGVRFRIACCNFGIVVPTLGLPEVLLRPGHGISHTSCPGKRSGTEFFRGLYCLGGNVRGGIGHRVSDGTGGVGFRRGGTGYCRGCCGCRGAGGFGHIRHGFCRRLGCPLGGSHGLAGTRPAGSSRPGCGDRREFIGVGR